MEEPVEHDHGDEAVIRVSGDDLLTSAECAQYVGVSVATWRSLVKQGYAPKADDLDEDRPQNMRRHRWKLSAVIEFRKTRPGRTGRPKKNGGENIGEQ